MLPSTTPCAAAEERLREHVQQMAAAVFPDAAGLHSALLAIEQSTVAVRRSEVRLVA